MPNFRRGNRVYKPVGLRFVGTVLAVYMDVDDLEWFAVVSLDKNEASDKLQHVYKLTQLAHEEELPKGYSKTTPYTPRVQSGDKTGSRQSKSAGRIRKTGSKGGKTTS